MPASRTGLFGDKTLKAASSLSWVDSLKACAKRKDLHEGTRLHDYIVRKGLLKYDRFVGNALVSMYGKCGALVKARAVLNQLPVRDVVSWSALIAGYAQNGQGKEALESYQQMKSEGLSPDAFTYSCILKACASIGALDIGKSIHDEIISQGLGSNVVLGGALVHMYAKCGMLTKAQHVLDELPIRNIVSWSALIAGYSQQGQGEEALNCYERMQSEGLSPNAITLVCVLKACAIAGAIKKGRQIHQEIDSLGLLQQNVVLGNALVDMYAKCGELTRAQEVMDKLPVRNIVSWSAIIAGYAQRGRGKEALDCYVQLKIEGLSPNAITYASILKACGMVEAVSRGKKIHDDIVSQGLLGKDVVLGNALVDMYAKFGLLTQAQQVLDEQAAHNEASWSALIAGYVQRGQGKEALNCFDRMKSEGHCPNTITYTSALKACAIIPSIEKGEGIHDEIASQGLLGKDTVLGTALVEMYAKCGMLTKAQEVLHDLPNFDVVAWSALMAGYVQKGQGQEALKCYEWMLSKGLSPDATLYACLLKACSLTQDVHRGKQIHGEIVGQELLGEDVVLGNSLINMYAKCGVLSEARQTFDELLDRDIVSWNALISGYAEQGQVDEALNCFSRLKNEGLTPNTVSWSALVGAYAQQGKALEALDCFQRMQHAGVSPNTITFVHLLNACSHSGLVEEGQLYFQSMRTRYGLKPSLDHHTCMVTLFGRAGHLDEAMRVIREMPSSDHLPVWSALLGSCRKWANVKLGRVAFEHAIQVDRYCTTAYVCMANIYTSAGMQEDVGIIEAMRQQVLLSSQDIVHFF